MNIFFVYLVTDGSVYSVDNRADLLYNNEQIMNGDERKWRG